jgi:hypothetical protein
MNNQDTIDELFTEWVNDNQDRIRFAVWVKTLTKQDVKNYKKQLCLVGGESGGRSILLAQLI